MSIPHASDPTRGPLEVTGQRIQHDDSGQQQGHRRPTPVAVSVPVDQPQNSPPRSRSHSQQRHSRSRSPPPRWSPSGNEARFGADSSAPFSAAPDPREFLRRGTGEWSHTMEQPLTDEERWQQEAAQREAVRAASSSPPRPPRIYGPGESALHGEIPHAHQSPPHPRRRGSGWPADRSASAEPQVHHDFLRAHTGGHAHPNLQPVHAPVADDDSEDFELELSAGAIIEAREPAQAARDESESPLRELAPPKAQRYPFNHRRSPEHTQQRSASASPSPSPARSQPISTQLHSHPLPVRPATAGPRPLPAPSTFAAAPVAGAPLPPGSTIASYIQRFRQRPPQPPSASADALSALPTFWWQTPAAATSAALVPPLPPPKQGTSTADHLRQIEQQIEEQRAEKRQQKLQQAFAKEMRAEQQQQQQQQSPDVNHSFDQSRGGGSTVGDSSFADFSMLDNLDSQEALQPQQHTATAAMRDDSTQQPRQSILDDSDDFSALIAPARPAQPSATVASVVDQSQLASDVSALLSISPQRRARPVGVVASPDVDELLRKWRAERAAGATVHHADGARERAAALLQQSLPSSPVPARSLRLADSPSSSSVDALISNLKKRLGLDQPREETAKASRAPLREIDNRQQPHPHPAQASKRDRSTSPLASSRKYPPAPSSSPPRACLTSRLHGSVEEMLDRPKVAKQDYLDSARRAAEITQQHEPDINPASPAPAAPERAVVIPPLRLPVAADVLPMATGAAPAVAPAAPLPPPSIQPHTDAPSAAHAPSITFPAESAAATSLPKADEAALLRLELQRLLAERDAACRGSHKKHRTHGRSRAARTGGVRGPRGVITIEIVPLPTTTAPENVLPLHPAPQPASAAAAPSGAATAAAAEELASRQLPPCHDASPVPIESVHFVSNAEPTVVEYNLPHTPERTVRPGAHPSSAAASPPRVGVADAAGSVREVVTRGLFCDASSYATIVSQLRPEAAVGDGHTRAPSDQRPSEAEAQQDAAAVDSHPDHHEHGEQPPQQQPPLPPPSVAAAPSSLPAAAPGPPVVSPPLSSPCLHQPPAVFVHGAGGAVLVQTPWGWAPVAPYAPWPQTHMQALQQTAQPDPAMSHQAHAALLSPSHEHLSRLCAELGMSVAEYYADPPLQALVRQLDALQRQQQQVQHITHAQGAQARMPLAH